MKYLGTITDPKDLTTKKYVDDSVGGVQTSLNTLSSRVDTNEDNIAMAESDIEGLQGDVGTLKTNMTAAQTAITTLQDTYVPNTTKVNGKALSADITLTAGDVGAVPTTRTVNNKALSSNITLTASDVGAVPTSRTINGKALTADITLTSTDLGMGDTSNIIYGEDAVNVEATTPINADTLEGHSANYFVSQTEFDSLANVARSGSYSDLSNTPSQEQLRAIYIGTTDPASSLGANGDIYIKYNG